MKQRVITGIVAAVFFVGLLWWGGYAFHSLLAIMALIGFDELVRMCGMRRKSLAAIIGYAAILLFVWPRHEGWYRFEGQFELETFIWVLMFIFAVSMVISKNKTSILQISALFFGVFYIGIGYHYMAFTRWQDDGLWWSLLLFVCIWLTDAGAYFAGYLWGKHKLWPAISPNKTIEGSLGGLALSIAAAMLFALWKPELIGYGQAAWIGLSVGIVGQMGDLIQSAYKRTFGVKDSGALLPGHGGILDRCDSWMIVFPFVHLVLERVI